MPTRRNFDRASTDSALATRQAMVGIMASCDAGMRSATCLRIVSRLIMRCRAGLICQLCIPRMRDALILTAAHSGGSARVLFDFRSY